MKAWRGIFALGCAFAALALPAGAVAATAGAQDEIQRPGTALSFAAGTDNGYEVLVGFPSPKLAVLYALRSDRDQEGSPFRTASYVVRTRSRLRDGVLRADFGEIGEVRARFVPDGKVKRQRVQRGCKGPRPILESGSFRGSVKLRGEGGYFSLAPSSGPAQRERSFRLRCRRGRALNLPPGLTLRDWILPNFRIVFGGAGGSVAQLRAAAKIAGRSIWVMASHEGGSPPGAELEVMTVESDEGMAIGRTLELEGGAGTLSTSLPGTHPATATLAPPAPFHGAANFFENSATSHSWTGALSVSLPGLKLPLTGPRFYTSLCVLSPLKSPNGCDFVEEKPMFPERLALFRRWVG